MRLHWILFSLLTLIRADQTSTTVPSEGTVETTPYSTDRSTLTKSDRVEIVVMEHFKSIVLVPSCAGSRISSSSSSSSSFRPASTPGPNTSSIGTTTVPVF